MADGVIDGQSSATKLRVLHLREPEIGGVQTVIEQYVEQTPEFEHVIARTTPSRTRVVSAHLDDEATARETRTYDFRLPPQIALRRLSRLVSPDVIHAHSSFAGLFARTTRGLGAPMVYTPHCFAFERTDVDAVRRRSFRFVEARLLRWTDVLAGASSREAALGKALRGNRPVHVVEVPHATTIPGRGVRSRSDGALVVGCVGRLAPQKRPDVFHQLIRATRRAGMDTRFVWVGDGDSRARRELEFDGAEVTGWLPQPEVFARLDSFDAVVHVADWEVGDPLVSIEAAALGLPVAYRSVPSSESNLIGTAFSSVDDGVAWIRSLEDAEVYGAASARALKAAAGFDAATQRSRLQLAYDLALNRGATSTVG